MSSSQRPPARLRRSYFDCRFGQLHVHQAIPAGGGFDEAPALVCLPGAAGLGAFFQPLLGALGADRSIYAPDMPGHGQSDPPPAGQQPAHSAALAVLDLLDSLRERRTCLLAHAEGAAVAASLVAQRPGLVLCIALSGQPDALPAMALPSGVAVRAFALAAPSEAVVPAAAAQAQLGPLLAFLGSARP